MAVQNSKIRISKSTNIDSLNVKIPSEWIEKLTNFKKKNIPLTEEQKNFIKYASKDYSSRSIAAILNVGKDKVEGFLEKYVNNK